MIQKKQFGRTGHESTRILFGAAALGKVTQEDADRTFEVLLKYGINHIDTAASYGESELRIGPWMPKYRDRFFLATKTGKRTRDEAREELENSLKRLQTDRIDLWQMHGLFEEEDWQTALGPGGALEAFVQAREEGLVRYLGVTGHSVAVPGYHLRSLERFDFDSVLLPWNYPMSQNAAYTAEFRKLTALCREKNVAVQTIKSLCRRPWPEGVKNRSTWYQPFEDQTAIDTAVAYILSHEQLFLNSTGDIDILPMLLEGARKFSEGENTAPTAETMEALKKEWSMEPLFT